MVWQFLPNLLPVTTIAGTWDTEILCADGDWAVGYCGRRATFSNIFGNADPSGLPLPFPAGYVDQQRYSTVAYGLQNKNAVGSISWVSDASINSRALLWERAISLESPSTTNVIDLHPPAFEASESLAIYGDRQVG